MSDALVPFEDRKDAFGRKWQGFQRRTLEEYWELGRELEAIMGQLRHGERGPWLAEIRLSTTVANDMRRIAREYEISELRKFAGFTDAVKALPPARPTPEQKVDKEHPVEQELHDDLGVDLHGVEQEDPVPPPEQKVDKEHPVEQELHDDLGVDLHGVEQEDPVPPQEQKVDKEHPVEQELHDELDRLRDQVEGLEERIAIILEGQDGKAVDAAFAALDAEKQAHARTHTDRNQALARERRKDRLIAGIKRDLLAGKPGDDLLAHYFGLARKAA